MSKVIMQISGDSPESVALAMLYEIADAEDHVFERQWVFETYKECLQAIRYPRKSE